MPFTRPRGEAQHSINININKKSAHSGWTVSRFKEKPARKHTHGHKAQRSKYDTHAWESPFPCITRGYFFSQESRPWTRCWNCSRHLRCILTTTTSERRARLIPDVGLNESIKRLSGSPAKFTHADWARLPPRRDTHFPQSVQWRALDVKRPWSSC